MSKTGLEPGTAVDAMTTRWLDRAGIGEGMRVVDIGCGPGWVTTQVAHRVGPSGTVYAVDREPRMLARAQARCESLGLSNVEFVEGTFELSVPDGGPVDAVVGRRVLMYQPDPVAAVRSISKVVRPGGLVWFHEHDRTPISNDAELPLHDRLRGWLDAMLDNEGAHPRMGHALPGVFTAAGLTVEAAHVEANVLTPTIGYPFSALLRAVLPRITEPGIATESEVDPDTLDQRLAQERRDADATVVWELIFGAWARTS